VSILELLRSEGSMSMADIAARLNVTNGALTPHIRQLSDCSLINVNLVAGKHGLTHMCLAQDMPILIDAPRAGSPTNTYETEIGVGHFAGYEAYPTCGLATTDHLIGREDEPRHFASPERMNAGIVWIGLGYFDYVLHNFLQPDQQLIDLQISMELASEAPGSSEDWPSDLHFYLNGRLLCVWTSPGDYARMRGIYTPNWWDRNWNQYGLFKLLSIDSTGTFIDGLKRSDVTLDDLRISHSTPLIFSIAAPREAKNAGGLTIFGRGFGNYDQGIRVRMHYKPSG
jgi:predicted transcriptional regulator